MTDYQFSNVTKGRLVGPPAHLPPGPGHVPLQGGRGQSLRPPDDSPGRVEERLPVGVQREGGDAGERGHLLRAGLTVPGPECTQICVRWRLGDPLCPQQQLLQREYFLVENSNSSKSFPILIFNCGDSIFTSFLLSTGAFPTLLMICSFTARALWEPGRDPQCHPTRQTWQQLPARLHSLRQGGRQR